MRYWVLGINVFINEIIVRFFGQSKHTFKALNKPIKKGYKIFVLCKAGYIYHFMWSLKCNSYSKFIKLPDLLPTEFIVY